MAHRHIAQLLLVRPRDVGRRPAGGMRAWALPAGSVTAHAGSFTREREPVGPGRRCAGRWCCGARAGGPVNARSTALDAVDPPPRPVLSPPCPYVAVAAAGPARACEMPLAPSSSVAAARHVPGGFACGSLAPTGRTRPFQWPRLVRRRRRGSGLRFGSAADRSVSSRPFRSHISISRCKLSPQTKAQVIRF